jgi:uncharacterized membrane protein YhaH (DUF805 family)
MFDPLKKYAEFTGRSTRTEYWLFFLFNLLLGMLVSIVGGDTPLILVMWLALLIPNIAVGVRRLHDINMSGWWFLINLLPILGSIVMFVFAVMPGTVGRNRFGDDPLAEPLEYLGD